MVVRQSCTSQCVQREKSTFCSSSSLGLAPESFGYLICAHLLDLLPKLSFLFNPQNTYVYTPVRAHTRTPVTTLNLMESLNGVTALSLSTYTLHLAWNNVYLAPFLPRKILFVFHVLVCNLNLFHGIASATIFC